KPEQYPIPDQYIVHTTYGKKKHVAECSIQYINDKPYFTIRFDKYMVHSTKSPLEATTKYYKSFKKLKDKGTLLIENIQEINTNITGENKNKEKDH
ncbi:30486_t:CDS:2, partial [Gigaspora margarita]